MTARDRRLLDFVCEIAGADGIDEFRHIVASGVGKLVAADHASYNEIDVEQGRALALTDQPAGPGKAEVEVFARLAHQNPLITRRRRDAETISDYLSARRFRALELYTEVYRDIGVEDQLAIALTDVGVPTLVGVVLNRSRRGFGAGDRATLELLRPHLAKGYRRALGRERARAVLDQLQSTGTGDGVGVIAIGPANEVDFVSDRARAWLRAYFPGEGRPSLPSAVAGWLQAGDRAGGAPFTVAGSGGSLDIACLVASPGDPRLLELRERRRPPTAPLTARERQVLRRVELGGSNQDIALALGVSRSTVENHLRSIYRKLGVTNRTAATARMRDAS